MQHRYVYQVVTTRGSEKAAVTAAMHHVGLAAAGGLVDTDPEPTMLWNVEVTDGAPVELKSTVEGPVPVPLADDLLDTAEW